MLETIKVFIIKLTTNLTINFGGIVTPIFKCLICRKDIERSTKTFWIKKGHLLCSSCLDIIEKKSTKQILLKNMLDSRIIFLNLSNPSLGTQAITYN